ncbi:winged helix-turn-helix domain-containing protein [Rhodobacteraceae bacterium N5(2021)]|uniref:Winged helix-turn-helix domain-containing protein n=1 Tax=Gymnodinialimonas phycosphaerae TaxID=2841589 RepID=A0A975YFI0_9RHOB|nr:winged helix-turn-helix domain-containing protein [Gymnodinialimonas phycosphaerae]MBY4894799.1 winged helix-turn-helix domain-containing protein [Gymnodinialimonas phycosphaerae]
MKLEVFEDQRRVTLDGEDVVLGARAFDVLAYLHANADRVVSKAELLDHVWQGMVVEEGNLSVQITGLRKALGREAIKTVPGVGYRLTMGAAPVVVEGPAVPAIPSLAVLPFANLTGSADKEYLVDGIVTEITSALGRVGSFFVTSSTSTFTYKGRAVDLAEVGRELGVRYVLEGSIQAAGDRIRIFTQLVEAETGRMIWQDRFDGEMGDIFDLQDRVAESVAGALEPKLIWAEAVRATGKPTASLSAYELCLRAAPMVWKLNASHNLIDGLDLLHRALELDPDYLQAKALVCYAHTAAFATRFWTFEKAQAALPQARQVLDSGTNDPLALCYAGHYIAYIGRAYEEGLAALQRAEVLNPNSGTVAMLLGWVHVYMNQDDAAIASLERAKRLSPLHPHIAVINCGIANALMQKGDLEAAVLLYEQARAEYPEFASNQIGLIGAYWALGRRKEAQEMADWLRRRVPDMSVSTFRSTRPQHSAAYHALICDALTGCGFPD